MAKKRSTATRRAESQAASARAAQIRQEQERRERRRRGAAVSAVVVVALVLLLGIGYAVQSRRDTTGQAASAPAGAVNKYALPVGKASAPVTVDVTEDFLCPICGQLESSSRSWLASYAAQGKVLVRYQPVSILNGSSNGTKYSERAASALAVVLDKSGAQVAKKFHDLLFENQPEEGSDGLSDDQLVSYAVDAGAKKADVQPGIDNESYKQWAINSNDNGTKLDGFQGTPFVRVNGKVFDQGSSMAEFSADLRTAVDAAAAG